MFFSEDETGAPPEISEKELETYRQYYELDKPLPVQYAKYLVKSFKGDFGYSIVYGMEISKLLKGRIVWTLAIVTASLLLSVTGGVFFGSLSAWYRYSHFDTVLYSVSVFLTQIPHFITASAVLLLFSTTLRGVLPTAGGATPFLSSESGAVIAADIFFHAVLPVLTLAVIRLPDFYLLVRSSMVHEISKKYVTLAKAKGLTGIRIIFSHCLRNAFNPVITRIFMSMGRIIGGAIIIENVFHYPGVGLLIKDAVLTRDYPLIQALFFIMALTVMIFSRLTELFYNTRI